MQIACLIISCVALACSLFIIIFLLTAKNAPDDSVRHEIRGAMQSFGRMICENQQAIGDMQTERFTEIHRTVSEMRQTLDLQLNSLRRDTVSQLDAVRNGTSEAINRLRQENDTQLERMRMTVDEKLKETLESRITKSFRLVNERLEQVYRGLGEMQNLAQGVGDLKRVLSNVKARGIFGEMQLGAILEQILAPEQYDVNVATVPGSSNVVEFAIKLPDRDGNTTYMPIDSKLPQDTYTALLDAYDTGDKAAVDNAAKRLRSRILSEARDIHNKYISPPATTDFAIMFLPYEGLYAEVVNRGITEELQNTYRVMAAGPSTMAAMLNAVGAGFKTLAIEKRSSEAWEILGSVKTEFAKFEDILRSAQKRINQANEDLDKLVGVRTRAIVRKLDSVERTAPLIENGNPNTTNP